jgi:hypothetical protein
MGNCANWRRIAWPVRRVSAPSNQRHWSTKRGSRSPATKSASGTGGNISSRQQRKPCGGFWWIERDAGWPSSSGDALLDADELEIPAPAPDDQLLDVSDALEKFAEVDARKAELVKLRYFVGMTFEEAAAALGIAVPTAKEWWSYARAWLRVEIGREKSPQPGRDAFHVVPKIQSGS